MPSRPRIFVATLILAVWTAAVWAEQNPKSSTYWPATAKKANAVLDRSLGESASADDWARRAWALSRYKSDHAAAAEAAAKALAIDPDHYKANEIAGIVAQIGGQYEKAFQHYLRLIPVGRPETELYVATTDTLNLSREQRDQLFEAMAKAAQDQKLSGVYRAALRWRIAGMDIDRGDLDASQREIGTLKMVTDWMVIGPFSNEENGGFDKEYGPETEIDYSKKYQGRDREVGWERLKHVDRAGSVDFDAVMYPNSQVLAYALTFVRAEKDTEAVLRFGAGNAVKAWVNDALMLSNDEDVAFAFDQYEVPCRLHAGWNKVLFKVCERHDQWKLAARFTTADGEPLELRTGAKRGEPLEIPKTPKGEGKADFEYVRGLYEQYSKLHKAEPKDPAATFYLARAASLTNRKMAAVAAFEKLVALNGKCSDHYALLAKAYLDDERPEKALTAMKEAISLEPTHAECLAELGRFYDSKNLFEKALATLRKAAEINPDWPDAQYYLLELYADKDWEERVWRQAEWLLARKPDVVWVLETYADKSLARGYREQAREYYERVLAQEYGNTAARRALISLAVEQRRIDDALEQYSILSKLQPLSISLRLAKAGLLMESRRYEEALDECRAALDVCEANFRVHKLMGTIYQRMGQDDKAMETWQIALKYNPDDKWIREYMEFIQPETIAAFDRYGISDEDAARIVKNRAAPADYPKADAVRLLDHQVVELNDDGSYTSLQHQIVQILNDSGRNRFTSMSTGGFNPKIKRAVVIQPDGGEVEASQVSGGTVKFGQLQVGSIIELKAQHRGSSNEWLSRQYTQTFLFQETTPALRSEFILLVPKSRTIQQSIQGDRAALTQGEFEDHVVYDYRADNIPMIEPERNRPPLLDIADLVRVSTIENWDEIIRWEYSLVKDQFIADDAVRAKVKDLTKGLEDREEKIRAVANFVMQKIQYRQDYDRGIMGIKPHKAGSVLEKEAGDCKDKATLLITMLREAGIPANYVTLRTRSAGRLRADIPSNQCDHAIAYVPNGDDFSKGIWIDGTANYSGIDTLPWSNQGIEVMVFKDDGQMVFMKTPVDSPAQSVSQYHIDLQLAANGSAKAKFTWDTTGQFASSMRQAFEAEGLRRQRLEQFANYVYPGSRVTSVKFSDLENRDLPVKIEFDFDAPNVGQVSGDKMMLRAKEMLQLTQSYADRTDRTYDIWNAYTATQRFVETYHLPKGFRVESMPEPTRSQTDWLDYELKVVQDEDSLEIRRELSVKALEIPKAAYDKVREFCVDADKHQREPIVLVRTESSKAGE
ncbi:MAG TPA: tetratricopeptide repeat protein [Phycisphaerae bacterium]|nr:tetratricopeptide repeat protein [Phycisphaerae bacterium]